MAIFQRVYHSRIPPSQIQRQAKWIGSSCVSPMELLPGWSKANGSACTSRAQTMTLDNDVGERGKVWLSGRHSEWSYHCITHNTHIITVLLVGWINQSLSKTSSAEVKVSRSHISGRCLRYLRKTVRYSYTPVREFQANWQKGSEDYSRCHCGSIFGQRSHSCFSRSGMYGMLKHQCETLWNLWSFPKIGEPPNHPLE